MVHDPSTVPNPFNQPIRKRRPIWPWVLGGGVFLIVALCLVGSIVTAGNAVNEAGKALEAEAPAGVVSDGPTPSPTKTNQSVIGEGQFEVGTHVKAGKYRTAGAKESIFQVCIWTVKDAEGNYLDSGTADGLNEPQSVTLKKGQSFDSSGCQDWVVQK